MPQSSTAQVSWTANTESDLAGYTVFAGVLPDSFLLSSGLITATTYSFVIPSASYPDGLWYFTVLAVDTSNNSSTLATPVSKRLVRSTSKLVVRR